MLKENNKVLKCSNASPDWRGYVDFVNNVVVDGLSRVICASLEYLLDQVITHLFERSSERTEFLNEIVISLTASCYGRSYTALYY